jgi:hypothetical protein
MAITRMISGYDAYLKRKAEEYGTGRLLDALYVIAFPWILLIPVAWVIALAVCADRVCQNVIVLTTSLISVVGVAIAYIRLTQHADRR